MKEDLLAESATSIVLEVAPNLYRLRLPMPYGLDHVNVYLLKETNRLALVDCGLDLPESWEALTGGLNSLGLRPEQLTDIFVTHAHPDHIGQLSRLRQHAPEARLYLHQNEYDRLAERVYHLEVVEQNLERWFERHGATGLDTRQIASIGNDLMPQLRPGDTLVEGGEQIRLKGPESPAPESDWQIIWTPGHTAGHFVLFNAVEGLLLSGDHLLTSISSNISKYPGSTDDPLGDFIKSLEDIATLEIKEVLPAHGQPFTNHRKRIQDLIGHHRVRLGKIYATLEPGPRTATEVVQAIWGDRAAGFHRYLALGEALSHLERLRQEGRVTTEEDKGVVRFRAA